MDRNNEKVKEFPFRRKSDAEKKCIEFSSFEYSIRERDDNGMSFNETHLEEYSKGVKYTVSVSRTENKKTVLYEYFLNNSDLTEFMKQYVDGKIEGKIIEIQNYTSEILA